MTTEPVFEFIVEKDERTILINREFSASLERVWRAWTEPALLDQWIAPKPWRAETKAMDFTEGGFWLYAMLGPEGEKHWSRYDYETIIPLEQIIEWRAFSNEEGTVNPSFLKTHCDSHFSAIENGCRLSVRAEYGSLELLEFMINNGFEQGIAASFSNLDELLKNLSIEL